MLIGIDARFYGHLGKGLGRYTQKLIEYLEQIDFENEYVVFLRKQNFDEYIPKNKNFKKVLADYRWYTFSEQLFFPLLLKKYKCDILHFPHFNVPILYFGKFIITIHDLILIHYPTIRSSTLSPVFYWFKFFVYKIVIKLAILRSEKIIAVSKFTKKDIIKTYGERFSEKIAVTYEASEKKRIPFELNKEDILKKYAIISPYVLYVGNVYPHKNPEILIDAFEKLSKISSEFKLVFIGSEDYFYNRLKDLVFEKKINNIIFTGFVPDCDLDFIFDKAFAYVRPSFYEGFQLPPLEAMSVGVPVICADNECAKEILEDSSLYFDGKSADELVNCILKLKNNFLRSELIKNGYLQVSKFSWEDMAKKTLNIYLKNAK